MPVIDACNLSFPNEASPGGTIDVTGTVDVRNDEFINYLVDMEIIIGGRAESVVNFGLKELAEKSVSVDFTYDVPDIEGDLTVQAEIVGLEDRSNAGPAEVSLTNLSTSLSSSGTLARATFTVTNTGGQTAEMGGALTIDSFDTGQEPSLDLAPGESQQMTVAANWNDTPLWPDQVGETVYLWIDEILYRDGSREVGTRKLAGTLVVPEGLELFYSPFEARSTFKSRYLIDGD